MTNEELTERIQAGENDLIPILWEQVERFVSQQAGIRARHLNGFGGVTDEDLYQAGFIALLDSVQSYDASKEGSFIGWLAFHLKSAFAEAAGYRTERQRRDPVNLAKSLDEPTTEDKKSTLADIIPDPTDACEATEERIYQQQLRDKMNAALAMIPEECAETIRRRFYKGMTLKQIGEQDGVSPNMVRQREMMGLRKLRHPRITRELEQFIEDSTPYFMRVGVTRFQNTHSSATEEIVMLRELMQRSVILNDNKLIHKVFT